MKQLYSFMIFLAGCIIAKSLVAQDTIRYIGKSLVNVDYHHGRLAPAIGVHNIQTMRANRADTGVTSWTYNHAPMLAWWNDQFFLEYLSNPVGEHEPPGQTLLQTSKNGYEWSAPVLLFPPYRIPDGFVKEGKTDTAKNSYAVMHQRIGFYTAKSGRFFALAYYGIVLGQKDDPNDGNGIGRVIREINRDGSLGPVHFLRYNHAFNEKNGAFPNYKKSKDKGLVAVCEEILGTPLLMMQTVEEADRNDPLIPLQKDFKAFNYYHLPDGKVVGLWKYALTSISNDQGKTWQYNPTRAPGFVNANAKIWGQQTSDGKYITVYNPSDFRWPLALSTSENGIEYKDLLLVNGEISSMRYGGAYKSYGPQYVRGILPMNGNPAGGDCWVTYSMNKEDMWISRIPVPVSRQANAHADVNFTQTNDLSDLKTWNLFSPLLCKIKIHDTGNEKVLAMQDADPFDYGKAEKVIPASTQLQVRFSMTPQQDDAGRMEIELQDGNGTPCLRIVLDSAGNILTKQGYRDKSIGKYKSGEKLDFTIELNTATRFYTVAINEGKASNNLCFAPVASVERVVFRTGIVRRFPDADTPTDQAYDLPGADKTDREASWWIHYLKTQELK